jgi:hypothetical protein
MIADFAIKQNQTATVHADALPMLQMAEVQHVLLAKGSEMTEFRQFNSCAQNKRMSSIPVLCDRNVAYSVIDNLSTSVFLVPQHRMQPCVNFAIAADCYTSCCVFFWLFSLQ